MKTHILVVEDSRTQRILIQSLLEKAGYQVTGAADGREALTAIAFEVPQLVVTDLDMPEMNGLELVRALKEVNPGLPVILTTAHGSELIAAESLRLGAASYVPKSSLADLVPTVEGVLALRGADLTTTRLAACMTYDEVHFELSCDESLRAPLMKHLQQLVRHFGLGNENTYLRVALALEESLQNAMIHGNLEVSSSLREIGEGQSYRELWQSRQQLAPYCDRRIFVGAKATPQMVEFVVRDEGPGFNVSAIPNPTDPAHLDKPSGRGLWLINAFMDEVRHNDQGNEITMILRKKATDETA